MGKADTVFALGIVASGVFLLEESLKIEYYIEGVPGPGFLPFWLSLVITGIGIALVLRGVRSRPLVPEDGGQWPDGFGWRRIAAALVSLLVALLLMESLGFFVVCIVYVATVAFSLGVRSWRILVPVPLLSAIVLYGVFSVWLKVPLPRGILDILG